MRHHSSASLCLFFCLAGCGSEVMETAALERWIDSPDKLRVTRVGTEEASEARAYHWTGAEIAKWRRSIRAGKVTLTSPELDFQSVLEIDTICVRVANFKRRKRLVLHWNDKLGFAGSDGTEQRRELTAREGAKDGVFVIKGDDIADIDLLGAAEEENAPRYLFLRFPVRPKGDIRFESLSVVGTDAALRNKPHGWTRRTVAGEIRDAFFLTTPGTIEYRTDLTGGGELAFGLHCPTPGESMEIAIYIGKDAGLLRREQIESSGRWHDVRIEIPPDESGLLTVELTSERAGQKIFLGNPMLLRSNPNDARPNVILYVIDTLRAEQTSLHGYPKKTTPFLEEIAPRGVLFRNAYSPVSWTKPSVATMLTSLYPQVHGVGQRSYSDVLPESAQTLQDVLRKSGYLTASFTANPLASTLSNLDQGFDQTYTPNSFAIHDIEVKENKIHSDDLNAEIMPWIKAHAAERFFLYVHTVDPHVPFGPPEVPPEFGSGTEEIDMYDAEIRFNDGQIERLHRQLVELGLAEDTLLIVTADHGEGFLDHDGNTGHGLSVYEEEVRVPLLFLHPGGLAPRVVEDSVQLIDLMPTILNHVGVSTAYTSMQGRNILDEQVTRGPSRIFLSRFTYPEDMDIKLFNESEYYAVIQDGWKLIASSRSGQPEFELELFDLVADPDERTDVSADLPQRTQEYHDYLRTFLEEQAAQRNIFLASHGSQAGSPSGSEDDAVSEDVLEQLRVLGYVE